MSDTKYLSDAEKIRLKLLEDEIYMLNHKVERTLKKRDRLQRELADLGYPRDLIARSFELGRDAVNSIIKKFRQQQNEQQH